MAATPSLILEILEAAFSCDDERALRLAEEAGCSRFDLSQLRFHLTERDQPDDFVDYNMLASVEAEGHVAGRNEAIDEAIQALVDADQSVSAIDALMTKFDRVAS